MQDALQRRPGPLGLYFAMRRNAGKLDKNRSLLRTTSLPMLCFWGGDALRDSGESNTARGPAPRGTVVYWLRQLMRLRLLSPWDEVTNTAKRRYRGDGVHKTTWIIHSLDYALDLLLEDQNIATPKGRAFWVLDGVPLTTEQATAWKLDIHLAERIPAAWEKNARSHNPAAPMKPMSKEQRPATQAEIDAVLKELTGTWEIPTSRRQAADIFTWARQAQPDISAEGLAAAITENLKDEIARRKTKNPGRPIPGFAIGWLHMERIRGIANVWRSRELLKVAEATAAAVARDRAQKDLDAYYATLAEPPPRE